MGAFTPEPEAELIDWPRHSGYELIVASARQCYSSKDIKPEDVLADERTREVAERVFKGVFEAGHHTTLNHAYLVFHLKRVSRQFIWSFLHSHPFYNSEQVSQRYVEVKKGNFAMPPLEGRAAELFEQMAKKQMRLYAELIETSWKTVEDAYYSVYRYRRKQPERWEKNIHKKVIELARYVLPVATHAHLYHTIPAITLFRYHKMCNQFEVPEETRLVVGKMVAAVREKDPLLEAKIAALDPFPLEETLEYQLFSTFFSQGLNPGARRYAAEFDAGMPGLQSKLIGYMPNAEQIVAQGVRNALALSKDQLSDCDAIDYVLNPAKNRELASTLRIGTLSKLTSVLQDVSYTFQKRISHTADSQNQRHRTIAGGRPVLQACFDPAHPDCIWPRLYEKVPALMDAVTGIAHEIWKTIGELLDVGVPWQYAHYLLPNATAIRFQESGSLLNLHHKWTTRLCYLAQDEIWKTCKEEVLQVQQAHPAIGRWLHAPCTLRKIAGERTYCPEGDRFCGVRVWESDVKDYERVF